MSGVSGQGWGIGDGVEGIIRREGWGGNGERRARGMGEGWQEKQ